MLRQRVYSSTVSSFIILLYELLYEALLFISIRLVIRMTLSQLEHIANLPIYRRYHDSAFGFVMETNLKRNLR